MPTAKILVLESERTNALSYAPALEKRGYAVMVEHDTAAALKRLQAQKPDVIVLDAASLKTSGERLVHRLRSSSGGLLPIVLVVDKKNQPTPKCEAAVVLVTPFTARKLINNVARLLPGDESACLQVGPIKLNMALRRIQCAGREERVTPKQAKLMEMFLRAPGQLLTRKAIIKYVWDTDYTGDTRTLDVHMSWLRSVVEADPRKPRYLKTVRGDGYRLDLPER